MVISRLDLVLIWVICILIFGYGIEVYETTPKDNNFALRILKAMGLTILVPLYAWKRLIGKVFR